MTRLAVLLAVVLLAAAPREAVQPDPTSPGSVIPAATSGRPIDSPVSVASGKNAERLLGAPTATVNGPPARGKGTPGDSGNGLNDSGDPLKLPRLDPQGLDQSGPGYSVASGAPPVPSASPQPRKALQRVTTARSASPAPGPVSAATARPQTAVGGLRRGTASTYGPAFSERWVALPEGPGWAFTVCGAGGCREFVSTDAGPDLASQRLGRIVDLPVGAFEDVCGYSWTRGLCPVTVVIRGRA